MVGLPTPSQYPAGEWNALWYSFIGRLENSTDVEGLWFPTNAPREIPFNCQYKEITSLRISTPDFGENGLGFHVCQLQGLGNWMYFPDNKNKTRAALQPTESAGSLRSRLYPYNVTDLLPARGPAFLVIASNLTLNQNGTGHEAFTKLSFEFQPAFLNYSVTEDVFFSLCFTSWESTITHVEMSTSTPLEEPSTEVKDGWFDLNAVLHQYGVGNIPTSRAILSLEEPHYNMSIGYPIQQPLTDRSICGWDFDTTSSRAWGYGVIWENQHSNQIKLMPYDPQVSQPDFVTNFTTWPPSLGNITTLFYYNPIGPNDEYARSAPEGTRLPDPSYQAFFTNAMNKTNNSPALSLSALLTSVSSSAYYEQFPILTKNATGEFALFMSASYPQSYAGLAAVISMMIGHWLTCFYVLYLFLSTTNFSRLGNAWANVAQVYGEATKDIIEDGTVTSDREVKQILMRDDKERRRVIIKNVSGSRERVEAVFHTSDYRPIKQPT